MVVVSHLFLFLWKSFKGRCDSHESHLPLFRTIYFPIAPCPVSKFAVMGGPDALGFSQKYAVLFQNHIQQLQKACVSLGGIPQKSFAGADLTCMIPVTSYFPVLLQFWEGDEEFPPKLMLLWDENSMAFLHYETTYYLQGDLLERLSQKL